jgi:hypothetical protein
MTQQHPYCRTCGSRTQSRNVCNHCGCEPMKGKNYCCDCGTSTIPEAIMCVECGASFQRKVPAVLAILIAGALVVTLAGAGFFLSQSSEPTEKITKNINSPEHIIDPVDPNKNLVKKYNESITTIANNIPPKLLRKKNDAVIRLANNAKPEKLIPEKPIAKTIIPEKIKEEKIVTPPADKSENIPGKISTNVFSSRELRPYPVGCTYYEGRSKSNIVFFTTNVYGYVKINGKVFGLQGVQKTADIARFSGAGYEVTIEIEGLAGNENSWVAAGTMVVKDVRQRTLSKQKIYSSCTDF